MEPSERYEMLSAGEIAALRERSREFLLGLIAMLALFTVVPALAAWTAPWVVIIIVFVVAALCIWYFCVEQHQILRSLNRDIREGKKKIVIDRVENQHQDIRATGNSKGGGLDALDFVADMGRTSSSTSGPSMSYAYVLKVRGQDFKVSELQYYECRPGQMVEVHFAPQSQHQFYFKILKDKAT